MNIKSYVLHRIVPLSMTLSDPRNPVSRSPGEYLANDLHPIHSIFGSSPGFSGSADRMALYFRFDKIQDAAEFCIFFVYLDIQKWPQLRNWFAD